MFPILFEYGSFRVPSYGFFIALGYIAALVLIRRLAAKDGLPKSDFSDLCFFSLILGLMGARVLFVFTNANYFGTRPSEIFIFWGGGLVFYGGFLLVLPMLYAFLKWRKLPLARSLDILAPGLALGHAIGRIGCFAAGCCHGSYCEYPWAVHIHTSLVEPSLRDLPIHPTQLYESFGLFLLCGTLLWGKKRWRIPGTTATAYVMGYAALRFVVEFFRGDSIRGEAMHLSTSQLLGILLFVGGSVFLARGFRRHH